MKHTNASDEIIKNSLYKIVSSALKENWKANETNHPKYLEKYSKKNDLMRFQTAY